MNLLDSIEDRKLCCCPDRSLTRSFLVSLPGCGEGGAPVVAPSERGSLRSRRAISSSRFWTRLRGISSADGDMPTHGALTLRHCPHEGTCLSHYAHMSTEPSPKVPRKSGGVCDTLEAYLDFPLPAARTGQDSPLACRCHVLSRGSYRCQRGQEYIQDVATRRAVVGAIEEPCWGFGVERARSG